MAESCRICIRIPSGVNKKIEEFIRDGKNRSRTEFVIEALESKLQEGREPACSRKSKQLVNLAVCQLESVRAFLDINNIYYPGESELHEITEKLGEVLYDEE